MSMRWWSVIVALSACSFCLGRHIGGRHEATGVETMERMPPQAAVSGPTSSDAENALPSVHRSSPAIAEGPRLSVASSGASISDWERAIDDDVSAAQVVNQAVIRAMEPRRRDIQWKQCVVNGENVGLSRLRALVKVTSRSNLVEVGDVDSVVVEDGAALAPDVLQCIAHQLAGHEEIAVVDALREYDGLVDFAFGVDFGHGN